MERPEEVALWEVEARSGMLSMEVERGDGRCLREECRGGEGARVEVECRDLV